MQYPAIYSIQIPLVRLSSKFVFAERYQYGQEWAHRSVLLREIKYGA